MRILAVDPGSKNIGLALSDLTGTIASPLTVLRHASRQVDAVRIMTEAKKNQASLIVVGQSLDEEGQPSFEGRKSGRLAEALRKAGSLPVVLWDEAFTTLDARAGRLAMGARRKKRSGHLDALAASILLQSYLDAQG